MSLRGSFSISAAGTPTNNQGLKGFTMLKGRFVSEANIHLLLLRSLFRVWSAQVEGALVAAVLLLITYLVAQGFSPALFCFFFSLLWLALFRRRLLVDAWKAIRKVVEV